MTTDKKKLYVMLVSCHGLIRGEELELGRDADTGGQVKYVIELGRTLGKDPRIERVDLLTRQVVDPKVDKSYAEPFEKVSEGFNIRRITAGPKRYLRKELLWDYLDIFTDQALMHIRQVGAIPDVIHGHYADAGYVARQLARLLGRPLIFTGHSLGRVKKGRLEANNMDPEKMEKTYNISRRVEAEELTLDAATMVVTSTNQEVREQYELYDQYAPERMRVIPPGVDLSRFSPPSRSFHTPQIAKDVCRFLREPKKPAILALSRADEKKNIETLVHAYGKNPRLQELANLILIAGNRDEISKLDKGAARVWQNLLTLIDKYDLYGKVAYPKHHTPDDVPQLYRWCAARKGVFVNPAYTEPFGLTLLEAGASGMPIVATNDGGPNDIIGNCKNGVLIDPFKEEEISEQVQAILESSSKWKEYSTNGIKGTRKYYSWETHVDRYLKELKRLTGRKDYSHNLFSTRAKRLPLVDRMIIADVDNTLTGDKQAARNFAAYIKNAGNNIAFGVATGRSLESTREVLYDWGIPEPDFYIAATGTEIYYGKDFVKDRSWEQYLNYYWEPERIRTLMTVLPGITIQEDEEQGKYKISYLLDEDNAPSRAEIVKHLRSHRIKANIVVSFGSYMDVLPIRATKGLAVRFIGFKWGVPPERVLVCGDSGNDREMLMGKTLGVVVANHSHELRPLRGRPRIYFAKTTHANGLLEGLDYYQFTDNIEIKNDSSVTEEHKEEDALETA